MLHSLCGMLVGRQAGRQIKYRWITKFLTNQNVGLFAAFNKGISLLELFVLLLQNVLLLGKNDQAEDQKHFLTLFGLMFHYDYFTT